MYFHELEKEGENGMGKEEGDEGEGGDAMVRGGGTWTEGGEKGEGGCVVGIALRLWMLT